MRGWWEAGKGEPWRLAVGVTVFPTATAWTPPRFLKSKQGEDEAGLAAAPQGSSVLARRPPHSLTLQARRSGRGPGQMGPVYFSAPRGLKRLHTEPARCLGPQPAVPSKGPVFQSKGPAFSTKPVVFHNFPAPLGWMDTLVGLERARGGHSSPQARVGGQ